MLLKADVINPVMKRSVTRCFCQKIWSPWMQANGLLEAVW
jgi:hypothetical protein